MATARKTPAARKPTRTVSPAPLAKPAQPAKAVKSAARPAIKPAAAATPVAPVAAKRAAEKPAKAKKPKLVRDSFTIPKTEYLVLEELKQRAGKMANPAKKSELLRAGIKALAAMSDSALLSALKAVPAIKTGRPSKD